MYINVNNHQQSFPISLLYKLIIPEIFNIITKFFFYLNFSFQCSIKARSQFEELVHQVEQSSTLLDSNQTMREERIQMMQKISDYEAKVGITFERISNPNIPFI